MATGLRQVHEDLLALVLALEELTAMERPDRDRLTHVRWRLSRASGQRLKLLEEQVYPALLARCSPAEIEAIARLRAGYGDQREASRRHVSRWPIEAILADWAGYRQDSAATRQAMRRRVAEEKSVIYPLLDKYAGTGD